MSGPDVAAIVARTRREREEREEQEREAFVSAIRLEANQPSPAALALRRLNGRNREPVSAPEPPKPTPTKKEETPVTETTKPEPPKRKPCPSCGKRLYVGSISEREHVCAEPKKTPAKPKAKAPPKTAEEEAREDDEDRLRYLRAAWVAVWELDPPTRRRFLEFLATVT